MKPKIIFNDSGTYSFYNMQINYYLDTCNSLISFGAKLYEESTLKRTIFDGIKMHVLNKLAIHTLVWILYVVLLSVRDFAYYSDYQILLKTNSISALCYLPFVYCNMYLLMPRLLFKKNFILYFLILTTLILSGTSLTFHTLSSYYANGFPGRSEFFSSLNGFFFVAVELSLLLCISAIYVLIENSFTKERKVKELERKNLQVELNQLKSQLNPHFLFNALNSIYVLIKSQPQKAQNVLVSFSDMLSHQLYDCSEEIIPIEKEISYLKNYIELESVRHSDKVDLEWKVNGDLKEKSIAPMIFMPFVENAFKHSLGSESEQFNIEIEINVEDEVLGFKCSNYFQEHSSHSKKTNGIGIDNIKRRLILLYPNSHKLEIVQKRGEFHVYLLLYGLSLTSKEKSKVNSIK